MPLSVAEINADVAVISRAKEKGGGYGTGRLIAPGLVLTAAHVICGRTMQSQAGKEWSVGLLRHRRSDGSWSQAGFGIEVIWRGQRELDLALLQLKVRDQPDLDDKTPPKLAVNFAAHDLIGEISEVIAVGFPEAGLREDKSLREYIVHGDLRIASEHRPYVWTVSQENTPDSPNQWQGISGAAAVTEGDNKSIFLFGAIQQVPANFTKGQLEVARLSDAFADQTFVDKLGKALGHHPQIVGFKATRVHHELVESVLQIINDLGFKVSKNGIESIVEVASKRTPGNADMARRTSTELIRLLEEYRHGGAEALIKIESLSHWALEGDFERAVAEADAAVARAKDTSALAVALDQAAFQNILVLNLAAASKHILRRATLGRSPSDCDRSKLEAFASWFEKGLGEDDALHLEVAAELARESAAAGGPCMWCHLVNAGTAYHELAEAWGPVLLLQARSAFSGALDCMPPDAPERGEVLLSLGRAYQSIAKELGCPTSLAASVRSYQSGLSFIQDRSIHTPILKGVIRKSLKSLRSIEEHTGPSTE